MKFKDVLQMSALQVLHCEAVLSSEGTVLDSTDDGMGLR